MRKEIIVVLVATKAGHTQHPTNKISKDLSSINIHGNYQGGDCYWWNQSASQCYCTPILMVCLRSGDPEIVTHEEVRLQKIQQYLIFGHLLIFIVSHLLSIYSSSLYTSSLDSLNKWWDRCCQGLICPWSRRHYVGHSSWVNYQRSGAMFKTNLVQLSNF